MTADNLEVRNIADVTINQENNIILRLLFDAGTSLAERSIREQFLV